MYRHCIYCSADLKANEAIEAFPVGRTLAFDAARGRLWAVCPKCARWNLAPLEERWEPVEQAERAFRDTRLRVQSENIGLAKLADGTRMVRIGAAAPGEMAAWRYGTQLINRRREFRRNTGFATLAGALAVAALGFPAIWILPLGFYAGVAAGQISGGGRPIMPIRLGGAEGRTVLVRRRDLNGARLAEGGGGLRMILPEFFEVGEREPRRIEVHGSEALSLLRRSLLMSNLAGAVGGDLPVALSTIEYAGGPEQLIRDAARRSSSLGIRMLHSRVGLPFTARHRAVAATDANGPGRIGLLALEMALHEEDERRALEGELSVLEAAWREAEEIAGIADRLTPSPESDA